MFEDETVLASVVRKIGGQVKTGEACGVTAAVVGRWIKQQHLPRTDYTGETDYAGVLAEASGFLFSRDEILRECNPANVKGRKMELSNDE